ncbi:MAG TPA: 4Fe-4S binding protein [Clostridia bacterium]|nr:4Fe-4S binding protein [Clostridia bacterium]
MADVKKKKLSRKKARKKVARIRTAVQILFFVIIAFIAVNHTLTETGGGIPIVSKASLHAVCPVGGLVSIYQFAAVGEFVKQTHASSFILMIIVFSLTIVVGPAFCGWICPFGSFQEWIAIIGRQIFGKRYNTMLPAKLDSLLRYLRYAVAGWVLYVTARSATLIFADYDPYFALFNFWSGEVALTAFIALALVVVLSLFIERPFCKYACPYGAVLGLFNLFRFFGIRRNAATCIDCTLCDKSCPMNIKVSTAGRVVNHQCISCLKCTSEQACPVVDTVELMSGKYRVDTLEIKESRV